MLLSHFGAWEECVMVMFVLAAFPKLCSSTELSSFAGVLRHLSK